MAIKVKRKTSRREEVKAPDQIYTFNEKVFNYIEENRVHLGIGLAAVLVTVVIVSFWADSVKRGNVDDGAALLSKTELMNSPIGESPYGEGDTRTSFESVTERAQAVREAVAELVSEGEIPPAAALADGAAAIVLGEVGPAQISYSAAASNSEDRFGSALAYQGVAAIQADTGDLLAAGASLQELAQAIPDLGPYSRLELARLTEAAGESEEAHRLYREFIESVDVELDMTDLVDFAEHRADVLEVVLGQVEAEEEPAEESPEEPADEPVDEPVEPSDDSTEEAVDDSAEEAAEEPSEDAPDDFGEEGMAAPADDEPAEEAPAENGEEGVEDDTTDDENE